MNVFRKLTLKIILTLLPEIFKIISKNNQRIVFFDNQKMGYKITPTLAHTIQKRGRMAFISKYFTPKPIYCC